MSDVVRSMNRSERYTQTSVLGSRISGGFRVTRWILLILAAVGVYGWWISRDTHEFRTFISTEPSAVIVAQNAFESRETIFAAPSWNGLPASAREHPVPSMFAVEFDAPDWVLRNLFGQHVLVVAPHDSDYGEAIYLSKMSRLGVLIERALRRSPNNIADEAGGLELRYLVENGLYYAVRGRLLIAGGSRRALIHALTLGEDERVAEESWDESIWNVGGEDVRGTLRLSEDSRWGDYFAGIGFALRVDAEEAVLKLKMPCTDAFYSEYIPALEGRGASRLLAPVSGPIQFSADVGNSYAATFELLEDIINASADAEEPWLVGLLERTARQPVAQILGGTGTAVARTWHGYVLNEIIPAPITSTIASNAGDAVASALDAAPTEKTGAFEPVTMFHDTERNWMEIATIGGPALTNIIALDVAQSTVLSTTSRIQAELNGWGGAATSQSLEQAGNLYLRIDPGAVLTEYEALTAELETGYAITQAEALERNQQIAQWREQIRSIREIVLVAEHSPETRTIQATLTVR